MKLLKRSAVLLQDREDMLEKIELLVARARPEIVAMNDERLFLFVAGFVDDGDAALLSEWRIGEHHFVFAMLTGERVFHLDGNIVSVFAGDTVQQEIHAAKARDTINKLDSRECATL